MNDMVEPDKLIHPRPTGGRKWAYIGLTVFAMLLLVETGARLTEFIHVSAASDVCAPYAEIVNPVPVFEESWGAEGRVYLRTPHHKWIMPELLFPAKKKSNAFRVFCLGGSAAVGWPNAPAYSYPEYLSRKLETLMPGRRIEVLNVAARTYGSHRVKFVCNEVLEYEPDLILIYGGNNEFLEQFVYIAPTVPRPWRYLAIARIPYRTMTANNMKKPLVDIENYGDADRVINMVSFAFGKASRLREDPRQFEMVLDNYRYNMESMIRECAARGIPIMLLDVPVNLKDWVPNVSDHGNGTDLAAWREAFRQGILASERGEFADAVAHLERAARIDDAHAETRYYLGRAYHNSGDIARATDAYVEALREDAYPLRALPRQQAILANLAASHNVPLVKITEALEAEAQDGIIGLDVLMDYVHPTPESNEIIAHAVVRAMVESGILPEAARVHLDAVQIPVPKDATKHLGSWLALYNMNLVMRQYDKLDDLAARVERIAEGLLRMHPDQRQYLYRVIAKLRKSQDVAKKYRRLLRAEKFGTLEQEFTHAEATRTFQEYGDFIRRHEARDLTPEEFDEYVPEMQYRDDNLEGVGD